VLDTSRGAVIATVPVGKRPRGLALSRDGSRLYVAVSGVPKCPAGLSHAKCARLPRDLSADGVAVVDTRAPKVLRLLSAGSDPVGIALARGERQLFVSNEDSAAVSVVELRAATLATHIRIASGPRALRISPNGEWIAVTSGVNPAVTLIDSHLLESVRVTALGKRPVDLVFAPDGREAYVADELDATVYRIAMPAGLAGEGTPVPAARAQVLVRLPYADRPAGIVLDASRRRLYVSTGHAGTVAVIALDGAKLIREVHVGARPQGLALAPNDRLLFVADGGSNDVAVVDMATLRVVALIPVGHSPWAVAMGD
jgi:YVTN family beta-propeller protein